LFLRPPRGGLKPQSNELEIEQRDEILFLAFSKFAA